MAILTCNFGINWIITTQKKAVRALDPTEEKLRRKRERVAKDKLGAASSSERPKYSTQESIEAASGAPACEELVNLRGNQNERDKKNNVEKEKFDKQLERALGAREETEVEGHITEEKEISALNEEEVSGVNAESADVRMKEREKRGREEKEESSHKIPRFEEQ